MEEDQCLIYAGFKNSEIHKITSWIQVGISSSSTVFLILVWIFIGIIPGLSKNVKTLIQASYIFTIFHNIFIVINQTRMQISYHLSDDCELFSAWSCMIVRVPQLFCFVGMTLSHLLVLIDRIYATWKPIRYEALGSYFSIIYITILVSFKF